MGFKCGILGLPNVGKSTLFNAMTKAGVLVANYPFATIDPNIGIVPLRDERLYVLSGLISSDKVIPTSVEFADIAGLVKGASQGEGLGNKFLGHIKNVDALVHVVRCFEDPDVMHVAGHVDPERDIDIINTELILSDLESVEKRLDKTARFAKAGDKTAILQAQMCTLFKETLENGRPIRSLTLDAEMKEMLKELNLLTAKPVLFAANVDEEDISGKSVYVQKVRDIAKKEGAGVVVMSGKIESEIAELNEEERVLFLQGLGLTDSGLDRLAKEGYELLGLQTYFTAGKKEVHAWTITQNTKAPQAAGVIHSDFEKGFIRAEIISYADFVSSGSELAAKEKGLMRLEGKEYIVKDGDIIHFRFAV